jgi:methionyl-tRNA formyltransferase
MLKKTDGAIDWTLPAIEIWRCVRAYNPWPGTFTALEEILLHIWEAWPLPFNTPAPPASVLALTPLQLSLLPLALPKEAIGVQTGDGVLAVLKAQRAGHRPLGAAEFLRGMPHLMGRHFPSPTLQ